MAGNSSGTAGAIGGLLASNPYTGAIAGLASLAGLGGDTSSSAAAALDSNLTFYNQAGINFNSNPGGIEGAPVEQSSTPNATASVTPSRSVTPGIAPVADNSLLPAYSTGATGINLTQYLPIFIIGIIGLVVLKLLFKK